MAKRDLKRYPTLITYVDPAGKTHLPPDPPLREGYPPWIPRPNEYKRDEPLRRCPDVKCRRAKNCITPHYGKFCQITHMQAEEFRGRLADKLDALRILWQNEPAIADPDSGMRDLKQALNDREKELDHQELLAWQTKWVEEQVKNSKPPSPNFHPPRRRVGAGEVALRSNDGGGG